MHILVFSQDAALVCFQVAILDDYINEEDEFFTVSLTTTDQDVTFSQDFINIKIIDDDGIKFLSFIRRCRISLNICCEPPYGKIRN